MDAIEYIKLCLDTLEKTEDKVQRSLIVVSILQHASWTPKFRKDNKFQETVRAKIIELSPKLIQFLGSSDYKNLAPLTLAKKFGHDDIVHVLKEAPIYQKLTAKKYIELCLDQLGSYSQGSEETVLLSISILQQGNTIDNNALGREIAKKAEEFKMTYKKFYGIQDFRLIDSLRIARQKGFSKLAELMQRAPIIFNDCISCPETCSICLDDRIYTNSFLTCGHYFHRHCIDSWLRKHRSCPICMGDVDHNN